MTWEVIGFVVFIFTFADKNEKIEKHEPNEPTYNH